MTSSAAAQPSLASSLRPRGPVHLDIVHEERPGEVVVRALGEVDIMTAPKLASCLLSILSNMTGDVVVDLTETEFLDSAGLHVLLSSQRRLLLRSRNLRVVCGPGPVLYVIELARLRERLNVTVPAEPPADGA